MSKVSISAVEEDLPRPEAISLREAFWFWLKLGFISFGGPAGQISIMHQELVERRRWISERRFLHALNYCMLLPGPEAQQLATYIGWLMHRTWGGVIAGVLVCTALAVHPDCIVVAVYRLWRSPRGGGTLLWYQARRNGHCCAGGSSDRLTGFEE
nr:chromate transporter [Pseudomonas fluorescens]